MEKACAYIQAYILRENLTSEARMPSGRELSALSGIDFCVMNRAIRELTAVGVLKRNGYKLYFQRFQEVTQPHLPIHLISPHEKTLAAVSEISAHYNIQTIALDWEWHSYRSKVRNVLDAKSSGLIFWYGNPTIPVDDLLAKFTIPVVTLSNRFPKWSSVEMDYARAAEIAVEHLASLNHGEIACVSEPKFPWHTAFTAAYSQACLLAGLTASAERVFPIVLTVPAMQEAMSTLRLSHPEVTGIIMTDVEMARFFFRAMKGKLAVPEEMSLVVYGEVDEAVTLSPLLTIVAQDTHLMGRHAATLLFNQIQRFEKTGQMPKPERLHIEPQLVARDSSAPPNRTKAGREKSIDPALTEQGKPPRWPTSRTERLELVERIWQTPYPRAAAVSPESFFQFGYSPFCEPEPEPV